MKNESIFVEKVKKNLAENEFNEHFLVHHFFTQYKLNSAQYFITKLEEIEKTDEMGIVGKNVHEARIYIDCCYYELIGAYDGIFHEINSALQLGLIDGSRFRFHVRDILQGNPIMTKIDGEWDSWIKILNQERVDYTHIKIRGKDIHFEIGKSLEVYDRYDALNPDKKTLVKKLRDYYNKLDQFIDDIYEELIKIK